MKTLQHITAKTYSYNRIIGTGGIGSGIFFSLEGNETLGRNESRMAMLLPYRDYCKQHIILHYISILLGSSPENPFQVNPIGKVGNDDTGKDVIEKMKSAGMDTTAITFSPDKKTLFSVCFEYPDHAGGNLTTSNSASSEVSAEYISAFVKELTITENGLMFLAAPEVPLSARLALLRHGRKFNGLNIASVLSAEVQEFRHSGGIGLTDILAVNIDEARHLAGISGDDAIDSETIAWECIRRVKNENPLITILITCGSQGVYCCNKDSDVEFTPALQLRAVSTAGAGDAFLAGFLTGIACGLRINKGIEDTSFGETPIITSVELGILLAAFSVTSPDTIHAGANTETLFSFINNQHIPMDPEFSSIFSQCKTL